MTSQQSEQGRFPIDLSIATEPNNINEVSTLLKDISKAFDDFTATNVGRKDLVTKCRTLVQALETPRETMIYHCWAQTGAIAGLNFGVDTGLWSAMAQNGDKAHNVADLASHLGVDPMLLREDTYRLTNYTKAMSIPFIGNGYLAMLSCTSAGPMRFHEFSRKQGWVNPTDAKDTALMYAYGTNMDTFAWQRSMGYGTHFNDHMGGYKIGGLPWMAPSFYPVKERLINGADTDPEAPFLVDIGGNVGHDLAQFHGLYPRVPGKLILQDLPVVIAQIHDLDPAIVRMEYDFHEEQPVKGARAYYMHGCLHDWPDDVCDRILARIKAAMKPGYSKLLIHEHAIPETGAYWEATALDMVMLTLMSSYERTHAAWYNLLETRAGLKILNVWSGGRSSQSIIECELPEDGN